MRDLADLVGGVRDDADSRSVEAASFVRGVGGDAETVRESLRDGEYDGDGDRDFGAVGGECFVPDPDGDALSVRDLGDFGVGVNCKNIACGSVSRSPGSEVTPKTRP